MEIDRNRFLSDLKKILFHIKDPQGFVDGYGGFEADVEHYRERVKNPTNQKNGKPIKETTLRQYKCNLDSALKLRNEAKVIIMVCQELRLLKRSRRHEPHGLRRSSAKLQVVHGGGVVVCEPEFIGPEPWLYRPVV